jgi:predicted transposase YbfD/YdcC
MEVNFPHARTALSIHHFGMRKNKSFSEIRYYISNKKSDAYTKEGWVQKVRDHWAGVENRLHWRKDACLREDHTRSRNSNIVGALALLRNALFAIFQPHLEKYGGLNGFTEAVAHDISLNYKLVTRPI